MEFFQSILEGDPEISGRAPDSPEAVFVLMVAP
jgi:hypothetical protein